MTPKDTLEWAHNLQNCDRRPPQNDSKNKHKNAHATKQKKNKSDPKTNPNSSQNRTERFYVLRFFWYLLPRWRQEASKSPLETPSHEQIFKKQTQVSLVCMRFCICLSIHGRACEDAHTVRADCSGDCLGVRRWPAAGVFDNINNNFNIFNSSK